MVSIVIYDVIYTLRISGDPTSIVDVPCATTINNPGYRESGRSGKLKRKTVPISFDDFFLLNLVCKSNPHFASHQSELHKHNELR